MANRTTLVDNNTWNNSHIALVGKAMSSNETAAYKIMTELDVDYVLVIFGGVIGYSGDDINKFLWMVRIAEGEHPKDIRVNKLPGFFNTVFETAFFVGKRLFHRKWRISRGCRWLTNIIELFNVQIELLQIWRVETGL